MDEAIDSPVLLQLRKVLKIPNLLDNINNHYILNELERSSTQINALVIKAIYLSISYDETELLECLIDWLAENQPFESIATKLSAVKPSDEVDPYE